MFRLTLMGCLLLIAVPVPGKAAPSAAADGSAGPVTITVMPFAAREGRGEAWLGKALADLLSRNLAEVGSFAVLERDRVQGFLRELDNRDTPLFSRAGALRLGRVAKVRQVVHGDYALKGGRVAVVLFLMDMETQDVLSTEEAEGGLEELEALMDGLTLRLLKRRAVPVSASERRRISFRAADSAGALESFYRGLDFYDRGLPADAFGAFAAAAGAGSREAALWAGRMFEALGFNDQAAVAYRNAARDGAGQVEGLDALCLLGRLQETVLNRPDEALATYRALAASDRPAPQALEASYRLGALLEEKERWRGAYEAFGRVDGFRDRIGKEPGWDFRGDLRQSRFFSWERALALHRDAAVRRVLLYKRMLDAGEEGLPPPPRGAFVLNPESPSVIEPFFGRTPPLFHEQVAGPRWRELIYAVIAPKGMSAVGARLMIEGRLTEASSSRDYSLRLQPFPLPRNPMTSWLGAVFGQTPDWSALKKDVPFQGRALGVLAAQVLENHGEVRSWGLGVTLRPHGTGPAPVEAEDDGFWEGRPLGSLPLPPRAGSSRPWGQGYFASKRDLALLAYGRDLFLVFAQGSLDGESADLWFSRSLDGGDWSAPERLPFNSPAQDHDPNLVRAEDGTIWLAWLSDRRGLGWELWRAPFDGKAWGAVRRVPLEAAFKAPEAGVLFPSPPDFDVMQDRHGRWWAALSSPDGSALVLLRSRDGESWTPAARLPTAERHQGPSLIEDPSMTYRLSALGPSGRVHLWSSRDGTSWEERSFPAPFQGADASVHRTRLFGLPEGRLLLLASDNYSGLQYARFHPGDAEPAFDLVTRARLEPYAAAELAGGRFAVALEEDDRIRVRLYRRFNAAGREASDGARGWPLYKERGRDARGLAWTRIFARARVIVPDVTALGIEPSGRVWWGIESGIMSLLGEEFRMSDVAQGFFHNTVTDIAGCAGGAWFSSEELDAAVLGAPGPAGSFVTRPVPGVRGPVTALACGKDGLAVGTAGGDLVEFDGERVARRFSLGSAVTVLAASANLGELWAGTRGGGAKGFRGGRPVGGLGLPAGEVTALAVDAEGSPWAAVKEKGLYRLEIGRWKTVDVPYASIGALAADPRGGLWLTPHPETPSRGLVRLKNGKVDIFNPPHDMLRAPVALGVDPQGRVWVGTGFDGVYVLEAP